MGRSVLGGACFKFAVFYYYYYHRLSILFFACCFLFFSRLVIVGCYSPYFLWVGVGFTDILKAARDFLFCFFIRRRHLFKTGCGWGWGSLTVFFFLFLFLFLSCFFIHPFRQFCKCSVFLFRWLAFPFYSLCLVWCTGKANSRKMGKKRGVSAFFFFFFSFFFFLQLLSKFSFYSLYLVWEFFFVCFGQILSALYSLLSFLLFPFSPSLWSFFFACGVGRTAVVVVDGDGRRRTGRERHIKWSVAWAGWLVGYRTGEGRREGECVRVILYFGWLALGVVDGDGDGDGIGIWGEGVACFFFALFVFALLLVFVILLFCYFIFVFVF